MDNKEEYNRIIDDVYKNYRSKSKDVDLPENLFNKMIDDLNEKSMFPIDNPNRLLSQKEFIKKCKTDNEFSEKWGLKIEERELTLRERKNYAIDVLGYEGLLDYGITQNDDDEILDFLDYWKVSTKLITVMYQNEKTEIYE